MFFQLVRSPSVHNIRTIEEKQIRPSIIIGYVRPLKLTTLAKIGSTKVCKARVSATNKKKCDTQFTVNHKKQKFCSPKCRNRNDRISKSDIRKKEQRQAQIELKQKEYLNTFRGKVDMELQEIRRMYNELIDYTNIKYPVLEKKDQYNFALMDVHDRLMIQAKAKEMEGKTKIPSLKDRLKRNASNLAKMLFKEMKKRGKDNTSDLEEILNDVTNFLDREYYSQFPVYKHFNDAVRMYIIESMKSNA